MKDLMLSLIFKVTLTDDLKENFPIMFFVGNIRSGNRTNDYLDTIVKPCPSL